MYEVVLGRGGYTQVVYVYVLPVGKAHRNDHFFLMSLQPSWAD